MKKKVLALVMPAVLISIMILSGCGGNEKKGNDSKGSGDSAKKQELTFSLVSDATTMDPIQTSIITDQKCAAPVYEGLLKRQLDKDGNLILVPAAAKSYDVSKDEKVYTFHLREDGKFSDGTPVTAEDVVYSWQRAFDPKLASPQSWQLEDMVVNAKACFKGEKPLNELGIKAVDDKTVEVTLNSPNPNFLTVSTFPFARIVSKAFTEKAGNKFGSSVDTVMGSGPYKLIQWEPGSVMSYEPNESYWDKDDVHLKKLTMQVVKEASTLAQTLMDKQIDIADLNDPDWNDQVDSLGYYNVIEKPQMSTYFFVFNCSNPKLSNWKIRLALSLGFDRDKYNNEVYQGKFIPAYSFLPPISTVGDKLWTDVGGDSVNELKTIAKKYPDPKKLLIEGMKEAGLGSDPSKLNITYTTLGTTELVKKSAEWMKQELEANLGIKLNIELSETNVTYDHIDAGDYEMAFGGWNVDSGTEPLRFLKLFERKDGYYGESKLHWTGKEADEYSKYAIEMQQTFDPDKLLKLYKLAEPIVLGEAPATPVYFSKQRTLVAKDVKGYQVHPFLLPDFVGVEKK